MASKGLLYLAGAIAAEVVATSALKASEGFTRTGPSLVVAIGYGIAFYLLSLTLKTIPVGLAYAIWSGVGVVLIALIGWLVLKQPLDAAGMVGIGLIVAGVLVIQLFSHSAPHWAPAERAWEGRHEHRSRLDDRVIATTD
mgnify:CR=1 FL=1